MKETIEHRIDQIEKYKSGYKDRHKSRHKDREQTKSGIVEDDKLPIQLKRYFSQFIEKYPLFTRKRVRVLGSSDLLSIIRNKYSDVMIVDQYPDTTILFTESKDTFFQYIDSSNSITSIVLAPLYFITNAEANYWSTNFFEKRPSRLYILQQSMYAIYVWNKKESGSHLFFL